MTIGVVAEHWRSLHPACPASATGRLFDTRDSLNGAIAKHFTHTHQFRFKIENLRVRFLAEDEIVKIDGKRFAAWMNSDRRSELAEFALLDYDWSRLLKRTSEFASGVRWQQKFVDLVKSNGQNLSFLRKVESVVEETYGDDREFLGFVIDVVKTLLEANPLPETAASKMIASILTSNLVKYNPYPARMDPVVVQFCTDLMDGKAEATICYIRSIEIMFHNDQLSTEQLVAAFESSLESGYGYSERRIWELCERLEIKPDQRKKAG